MLRNKLEAYLRQNMPQQEAPQGADGEVDVAMPAAGELADKLVD
jgi:hypothetical protein